MAFFTSPSNQWPDGILPYEIRMGDFNSDQIIIILQAIAHWNQKTIIRVIPRTGQEDYVVFRSAEDSCSSAVGRRTGEQFIGCDIGDGFNTGSVIHEIGHAVGLHHEQTRPDRDQYVLIDFDNIEEGKVHNFDINSGVIFTAYDYDSLMHYRKKAFAVDPNINTITPTPDSSVKIGQSEGLSLSDIQGVCLYYNAPHFCVVWQDDRNTGISNEIFLASLTNWGKNCTRNKIANSLIQGNQLSPDVGMDQNGASVVIWQEDLNSNNDYSIKAKGIWPDGGTRFEEFCIHSSSYGDHIQPSITVAPDGSFIAVWIQRWESGQRLLGRGFDASGRQLIAETLISTGERGTIGAPSVERSADGSFVIVWGELSSDEVLSVHAQGFTSSGAERWPAQLIADGLGDQNVSPRLAIAGNGDFTIVWEEKSQEIKARSFLSDGTPRLAVFTVNEDSIGPQYLADIAMRPTGEFLIAWTDDSNENGMGQIYLKGFNADGTPYLSTRTVNRRGGGRQSRPRIAMNTDGNYYIVWQDDTDNNGVYQIHANAYSANHQILFSSRTINEKWLGQQVKPAVATR